MVRGSLNKLKASLNIQMEELNVTIYNEMPDVQQLIEACAAVPFLADNRLVVVRDCALLTSATGGKDDAKRLADYIERLPDTTVLVLCTPDAPDKRKTLYKRACEIGVVKDFEAPNPSACAAFAAEQAKAHGAKMNAAAAQQLVALAGCDYYALENEVSKLAVYAGFGEITAAHVNACVSKSLEYNVFEIHKYFVNRQASQARDMLEALLEEERPEMLLGLFARKLRDMYKVKTMLDVGYGQGKIASLLGMKPYPVQMLAKECARFSQGELRWSLNLLAELDFGIKSGRCDAALAMADTLARAYKL